MPTAEKTATVEELARSMTEAKAIFLADFTGIDVAAVTDLRRKLREASVDYRVVKNRLAKLAAESAGIEGLGEYLTGPTAIAFAMEDPVAPAKVLDDFIAAGGKLAIKSGYLEGTTISQAQVTDLAKLPSREELIAKLLGGVQGPLYGLAYVLNAPLSGFVNATNGMLRNLVGVLAAIEEQRREEAGEASA